MSLPKVHTFLINKSLMIKSKDTEMAEMLAEKFEVYF
jgi:hypothetical protein